MKIAHITAYCPGVSTGGTERYISDLITGLERRGVDNRVVWLASPFDPPTERASIMRLPRAPMRVDDPPPELAARTREWLQSLDRPDLLHFHTLGRSEAVLATAAGANAIPYVFTFHSPAWTCRRETLLRWGGAVCDGEVRALRCAACKVQERLESPPWIGWLGALASAVAGPVVPPGPWRRRLAFTPDTARYRRVVRSFLAACARSIACAEWSIPVLTANGARPETILHMPQGVPEGFAPATVSANNNREVFVVGYIGRMHEVKGVHILIEGFRHVRSPRARLRVHGWSDAPELRSYGERLKRLAGDDPRIEFVPEQPPASMPAAYAQLSLLAIPSVWLETGPLTLLEALHVGVPVYASARMGQRSLLDRYGRLVDPNTPAAWGAALTQACEMFERGEWKPVELQEPIPSMSTVAARMDDVYREVCSATMRPVRSSAADGGA